MEGAATDSSTARPRGYRGAPRGHEKSSGDANSCGHEKAAATLIDPN